MALRRGHRNIGELLAATRAAEHQSAAAHVSSTRKFGREEKTLSENFQQGFDIFRRGDAAKQDDFAVCSEALGEQARIAFERNAVSFVGQRNRGGGDIAEIFPGEHGAGGKQTAAGCNHEDSARIGRRLSEGRGVSELAAEVEAADKGEGFAESQAAVAEPQCQREGSFFAQHQLGANTACICRRQQKDAANGRSFLARLLEFRWLPRHARMIA
jgi:hypothetical protein